MKKTLSSYKKCLFLALLLFIAGSIYSQAPTIISFSPASGPVGTLVTITGTNLSSPTAFTIGGVSAIVVSNTGTTLVGLVMPGAASGAVSITTSGGSASGSSNFTVVATPYPNIQQGNKLVGTGAVGAALQGGAVAISADGNTAIVGGQSDSSNRGAAWIYTRSAGVWSQQGTKLVGTGASAGTVFEGMSVAISADGNTAMLGGAFENPNGGFWFFTRTGNTWSQQGPILLGTGLVGISEQGWSVSLSADGNTALIGAPDDSSNVGAAWVFIRTAGVWSQQGPRLRGTGNTGGSNQGFCVALSADGNTAAIGGGGITLISVRYGYSSGQVEYGHSRAINWSVRV